MQEKLYKKYFTEEQLSNMKASTARDLKKQEDGLAVGVILLFASGFLETIMIIAMLFWTNKFTMFLTIVGALFVILLSLFHYAVVKKYRNLIAKAKEDSGN